MGRTGFRCLRIVSYLLSLSLEFPQNRGSENQNYHRSYPKPRVRNLQDCSADMGAETVQRF
jgi:hypothetical protein